MALSLKFTKAMATVTFRLNRPKHKDGTLKTEPVSILVQLNINESLRPEIATGENVRPQHFKNSRASTKALDYDRINDNLTRIEKALLQLWRDNINDLSKIRGLMPSVVRGEGAISEKKTLWKACDRLIRVFELEKDPKYVAKFKALRYYLEKFEVDRYPISLESMNTEFYYDFKEFLYAQPNQTFPDHYFHNQGDYWTVSKEKSLYKVGLFDDTVYKYIINLKILMGFARKLEYNVHPSYPDWPLINRHYPPISLTLEELCRLEATNIQSENVSLGRDYLALECRIGRRISDLKRFDIKDYFDYKWTFRAYKGRRLSNTETTVHFVGYCEPALKILAKHNFKMPVITDQRLNDNIRLACKLAKIDTEMYTERWAGNKCVRFYGKKYEFLSSHTGRKTFITLGLQFMKEQIVMELSGITSYATLKKYAGKPESTIIEHQLISMDRDSKAVMKKLG